MVRRLHAESYGVYGSPKIWATQGCSVNAFSGSQGLSATAFQADDESGPSHPVADNILQQDFTATSRDQRWAADITYLSTRQGWLYLAVVMDLYSRRIEGWSMSQWMSRHLVIDALTMALTAHRPERVLIHHSDRGAQYTSDDFRAMLDRYGIQYSMSGRGNCFDNTVVESFFGLLKRERENRVRYQTRNEARADVFDYIECFYSRKRRHGYPGDISPAAFEQRSQGLY